MTIPLNIKIPLERAEKRIKAISRSGASAQTSSDDHAHYQREIQEITESLSHVLDRIMNMVWEQFRDDPTRNKPNVYWPVCATEEALVAKMAQLQLSTLRERRPDIYGIIRSTQSFSEAGGKWCATLKTLANLKHERDAHVENRITNSMSVGRGESIYIKEFSMRGSYIKVDGHEIAGGVKRPLTIEHRREFTQVLEGAGMDPVTFHHSCLSAIKNVAHTISSSLKASQ